jgi:hypothetical protein
VTAFTPILRQIRAREISRGRLGEKRPLRFCLTVIENPQPFLEVASIALFSCKSQTAPCIMAMTTGKSGLMK